MEAKVEIQWWDGPRYEIDFIEADYETETNGSGQIKLTVDQTVAQNIIAGSFVYVVIDGIDDFGGRLGPFIQNANGTITFDGTDWMGDLANRLVNFKAADWTEPDGAVGDIITEKEATVYLQRLLKTYTGKTNIDSDFDLDKYVKPSTTVKKWVYNGLDLKTVLANVAQSSAVNTSNIGFNTWFDAVKNWHFEPQGAGNKWKDQIYKGRDIVIDPSTIINKVTFRGSTPPPLPTDRDYWTDGGADDQTAYIYSLTISHETGAGDVSTDWRVQNENTKFTGATTQDADGFAPTWHLFTGNLGKSCIKIFQDSILGDGSLFDQGQIFLDLDAIDARDEPFSLDWSDGEGVSMNPVEPVPSNRIHPLHSSNPVGNNTIAYIEALMKISLDEDGDDRVPFTNYSTYYIDNPAVFCRLITASGAEWFSISLGGGIGDEIPALGANGIDDCVVMMPVREQPLLNDPSWKRFRWYVCNKQSNIGDISDVKGLLFSFEARNIPLP